MRLEGSPSGVALVVATGATLHVPDARGSGEIRRELVEAYDAASVLFVPIAHDDEVRSVAIMLTHAPRTFTPDEIADAETLAQVAAAGLARLEAEHRRTARAAQDHALVRAARALNQSLELHEVLRTLAREAALAVGADIDRRLPRQRARGRRRHRRPQRGARVARHPCSSPARARPARRCSPAARSSPTTTSATRPARSPRCAASAPPSPSRWSGTTSSRARCRSAGPRCAGSRRRTAARSRRSPTSPPSPATTPRPTTRSSRPRAPTR